MQRRSVARQFTLVIVDRDLETIVGVAPVLGVEDQVISNNPQRSQIGGAAGAFRSYFPGLQADVAPNPAMFRFS